MMTRYMNTSRRRFGWRDGRIVTDTGMGTLQIVMLDVFVNHMPTIRVITCTQC